MLQTDLPNITDFLSDLSKSKLIIDPALLGLRQDHFEDTANGLIEDGKERILQVHYGQDDMKKQVLDVFFETPVGNDFFVEDCIENFIICTAVYMSYDLYGKIRVDKDIAQMALNDVTEFIERHSVSALCQCYIAIVGLENAEALAYYGHLKVEDFISGAKHRPWAARSLPDELNGGVVLGLYEIFTLEGERFVRLTPFGVERLRAIQRMLEESGYIDQKLKAMYISQFDQSDDWDEIAHAIGPTWREERQNFIQFFDLKPGSEVLELGCGTGELTFGAGLYKAVGESGFVTATDPSVGMVHQGQMKLDQLRATNVILEAATAEHIPFDDNEFDAVLGVSYFHFTQRDLAMNEMIRVTRNGGIIGMFQPITLEEFPRMYFEWFKEFFEMAGSTPPPNYLPRSGELKNFFEQYHIRDVEEVEIPLPAVFQDADTVVKFLMNTVGFFQLQMIHLPCAARTELIERLRERGRDICERYSLSERTLPTRAVFIKGTVNKA